MGHYKKNKSHKNKEEQEERDYRAFLRTMKNLKERYGEEQLQQFIQPAYFSKDQLRIMQENYENNQKILAQGLIYPTEPEEE